MKHFPSKTRGVKVGASFPGRSRDVAVKQKSSGGPSTRPAGNEGKKPAKGVLLSGGGHG